MAAPTSDYDSDASSIEDYVEIGQDVRFADKMCIVESFLTDGECVLCEWCWRAKNPQEREEFHVEVTHSKMFTDVYETYWKKKCSDCQEKLYLYFFSNVCIYCHGPRDIGKL